MLYEFLGLHDAHQGLHRGIRQLIRVIQQPVHFPNAARPNFPQDLQDFELTTGRRRQIFHALELLHLIIKA
jgi:hypothetical protein